MAKRTWLSTSVQTADQVTNTTTKTYLSQYLSIPIAQAASNQLPNLVGSAYRVTAYGYISTGSSPGTLAMTVDCLQNATDSVLGTTGAITPPGSLSSAFWKLEGIAVFNSNAIAAFFGEFEIQSAANTPWLQGMVATGTGTSAFTTGLSMSGGPNTLKIGVQWGTASASNILTASMVCFEQITNEQ
jgi:hypothetical protein